MKKFWITLAYSKILHYRLQTIKATTNEHSHLRPRTDRLNS